MSVLTLGVAALAVAIALGAIGLSMAWGPANRRVANGKARRVLGWRPKYPDFKTGFGEILKT